LGLDKAEHCIYKCSHNETGVNEHDLQFEWDETKAAANLAKHGVSFLTAAEAFASELLERVDDREDYGELRFIALSRVDLVIYRIVFTWRGEQTVRLISAQKATANERDIYYRETFT
jgi:uncharacterized DUF497 family protein